MSVALEFSWLLPVLIGVFGVLYFAMKDLAPTARKVEPLAKTEG